MLTTSFNPQAATLKPQAFTLVELLVVVAIIVVLLALLLPAMDKAIYQAELVQCAGNEKGVASAGTTYAVDQRRHYPSGSQLRSGGNTPHLIGKGQEPAWDMRPALQDYVPLKMLSDPLAEPVDLSFDGNDADTAVYSNYEVWMGWRYTGGLGGKGMIRLGDRVEWVDNLNGNRRLSHDFLISDRNALRTDNSVENPHPDKQGSLVNRVWQNEDWVLATTIGPFKVTASYWVKGGGEPRGTVDLHYASADGSVTRHTGITGAWNNVEDAAGRMFFAAPWDAVNSPGDSAKLFLPGQ